MSGFTPGPWVACDMVHAERGDHMTPAEIGEYVANSIQFTRETGGFDHFLFVMTPSNGRDVCHVGNGPDGPSNARLIAAAPELLEALQSVLAVVEHPEMRALWTSAIAQLGAYNGPRFDVPQIRAAILKASPTQGGAE